MKIYDSIINLPGIALAPNLVLFHPWSILQLFAICLEKIMNYIQHNRMNFNSYYIFQALKNCLPYDIALSDGDLFSFIYFPSRTKFSNDRLLYLFILDFDFPTPYNIRLKFPGKALREGGCGECPYLLISQFYLGCFFGF